jgi:hypothetical protein
MRQKGQSLELSLSLWDGLQTAKIKYVKLSSKKGWPGAVTTIFKDSGGQSHPGQLDPHPKTLTTPVPLRGEKHIQVSEGRSFEEMSNVCSNCCQGKCLVLLQYTFI